MPPSQQCFVSHDVAVQHRHDRLVEQAHLIPRNGVSEVGLQFSPLLGLPIHRKIVEGQHTAAIQLGAIKCKVCGAHQRGRIGRILREQGYADADADGCGIDVAVHLFAKRCQDVPAHFMGPFALRTARHDDHELVAAEARDGVAGADAGAQDAGHVLQDAIALRVAEQIVHHLEAVQIKRDHSERLVVAFAAGNLIISRS